MAQDTIIDDKLPTSLKAEMADLPGTPTVVIDGSRLDGFTRTGQATDAVFAAVDADHPAFARAWQVKVLHRTDPAYNVQLFAPRPLADVKKGDTLLLVLHTRCLASEAESGGGHYVGWLSLPREPWTTYVSFSGAPGRQWGKRYVSLVADHDIPAADLNITFHLGQYPQTIEFGGLSLLNLGQNVDRSKVPVTTLSYIGQEDDASWRKAADERIDKFRKGDLRVEVRDAAGDPVADAEVSVRMKRHAYQFGVFLEEPTLWDTADGETYRQWAVKLFNRATVIICWADWGWDSPEFRDRTMKTAAWARKQGMHMQGNNLIWPSWQWTPKWYRQFENDKLRLSNIARAMIAERVAMFRPFDFDDYVVINEMRDNHDLIDIMGLPEATKWFKLTRAIDPRPKLGVNEYSIVAGGGHTQSQQDTYLKQIKQLQDDGANLDFIGVQCHMSEDLTPPESVLKILDRLAETGLPIQATEFDINVGDEAAQGRYMKDFLTVFFSHPSTTALTQWGFWEGKHWIPRASLFRKDWSIKPNGQAYMDQVLKAWWTNAQGKTQANGVYQVRGFLGDYDVSVTVGGKTTTTPASLVRDGTTLLVKP